MDIALRRFAHRQGWVLSETSSPSALRIQTNEESPPTPSAIQALRQHCPEAIIQVELVPAQTFEQLWQTWLESGLQNPDMGLGDENATSWEGLISSLNSDTTDLLSTDAEGPMIRLLNSIISEALRMEASDIHCTPQERLTTIAFRCDGQLHVKHELPRHLHAALCARVKVMAHLDVAETRHPQDGRLSVRIGQMTTDVRVSCVPTTHGERIVLRLLHRERLLTLHELGMASGMEHLFNQLIRAPHGLILVTGPTGSGKTTTLYAALDQLRSGRENIITVEDPVEYRLEGISQIPVQANINFNFPEALRAILRQDPDIIMIGEIRDRETAQIAIQASLTGHLVLATLHTNDAPSAISRLLDMGVEPFLLASTLRGILAQRLIRTLCPHCKTQHLNKNLDKISFISPTVKKRLIQKNQPFFEAQGCDLCNHFGFKGRTGIYELISMTPMLQELIQHNTAEQAMRSQLEQAGHTTLFDDGMRWVESGESSLTEVCRIALTTTQSTQIES